MAQDKNTQKGVRTKTWTKEVIVHVFPPEFSIYNVYTSAVYQNCMGVVWDEKKNAVLKRERGISFEEIAGIILDGDYIDIVENPTRENQLYFILAIHGDTWVVPFVIDDSETIILKTLRRKHMNPKNDDFELTPEEQDNENSAEWTVSVGPGKGCRIRR